MNEQIDNSLPFLTREMLKFGKGAKIELRIRWRSVATKDILINGLTRDSSFQITHRVTSNTAPEEADFRISDIPITVNIAPTSGSVGGQTRIYVQLILMINGNEMFQFFKGYLSRIGGLSFPTTTAQELNPFIGRANNWSGANPAAGSEAFSTITAGLKIKVMSIYFTLVTDSNVADRRVHLEIQDSEFSWAQFIAPVVQAASLTRKYWAMPFGALPTTADDNDILIPIPDNLILDSNGDTIFTATTNLQAGDDFGPLRVHALEYQSDA